jgi:quinol monooxygenase YgiN
MPYIRLSIARPRRGEEDRLLDLMRKLSAVSAEQDGCIDSYVLKPRDDSGEIARISVYRDEQSAEAAASSQTIMSLRSEIHLVTEPGHTERAFFSV